MTRSSYGVRFMAVVLAFALTSFSVGFSWAVVTDYTQQDTVPHGASVAGCDVGGLPREKAVERVRERIEAPLMEPVTLEFRGKTYELASAEMVKLDVEGMVEATFAGQKGTTLAQRAYRRLVREPAGIDVTPTVRLDEKALRAWVDRTGKGIHTDPVDSKLTAKGTGLNISASHDGYELDRVKAVGVLSKALVTGDHDVKLPIVTVKPKTTEKSFPRTLLVRKSQRRVYLFHDAKRVKTYPIAVGTGGYPTPTGRFKIERKQKWPSWHNPGGSWAAGMPDMIPPGPSNPLGTRAIYITSPGIRFHGTQNDASVGTAASHGCMRMHRWDVEDLFERVEPGDAVLILP